MEDTNPPFFFFRCIPGLPLATTHNNKKLYKLFLIFCIVYVLYYYYIYIYIYDNLRITIGRKGIELRMFLLETLGDVNQLNYKILGYILFYIDYVVGLHYIHVIHILGS